MTFTERIEEYIKILKADMEQTEKLLNLISPTFIEGLKEAYTPEDKNILGMCEDEQPEDMVIMITPEQMQRIHKLINTVAYGGLGLKKDNINIFNHIKNKENSKFIIKDLYFNITYILNDFSEELEGHILPLMMLDPEGEPLYLLMTLDIVIKYINNYIKFETLKPK